MEDKKYQIANQSSLFLLSLFFSLSLVFLLFLSLPSSATLTPHRVVHILLRIFAEEDYDHDMFGHIGHHPGLHHWRILWIVIKSNTLNRRDSPKTKI